MSGIRVAALYDIHANMPALEAVLADVERAGADLVLVGGDIAWGPMPRETLARILALGERVQLIRGNADREVAARAGEREGLDPLTASVNLWCADQLEPRELDCLAKLPERLTIDLAGLGSTLFCHGSPRADDEPITQATSERLLREMLEGVREAVVVCGHTHAQFIRTVDGTTLVNPGSVGLPFGDPGAYWALLGPAVDLRRTTYDVEAAAALIQASGCPRAAELADHVLRPPPWSTADELFTRG